MHISNETGTHGRPDPSEGRHPSHGEVPADGGLQALAQFREEAQQGEQKKSPVKDEEYALPEFDELISESPVTQDLNEDARREAIEMAEELDFDDPVNVMNYGLEEQQAASEVTRKFIQDVRATDLKKVGTYLTDANRAMQELNFGDMKPTGFEALLRKVLPKRATDAIDRFSDKHQQVSDVLDEQSVACGQEREKLLEARTQAQEKVDENAELYKTMSKMIAAAELRHAREKKEVELFKKKNAGTRDQDVLRQMELRDKTLTLQARHINSMKAFRTEMNNSTRTFQEQIDHIDLQIQNINDQQTFNRIVWDNTALMIMIDAKTADSVKAVKYNRETVQRLLEDRADNVEGTCQAIRNEAQAGVVDVAVMEAVTLKNLKLIKDRIEGYKAIREAMEKGDRAYERMEKFLDLSKQMAVAVTSDDEAALEKLMSEADSSLKTPRQES
ncbi:MAG: toxic anion resistance protein [Bdellovibrionales bacterium]|nr:toxic anion resistance protein [Bdellovibrionales bacterium]